MDREELLGVRRLAYDEYKKRKDLGDFDANSEAIRLCLHSLVEITTHLLEELKKQDVYRKTKPSTD